MHTDLTNDELAERYYVPIAAAYARSEGHTADDDYDILRVALAAGLKFHRFKRTQGLPRVQQVLGILRGLQPDSLLDIGSGRGVFLWPLLDEFPELSIQAIDLLQHRIALINAVADGGFPDLSAAQMDATALDFEDDTFDIVTALEVLEHIPDPAAAAAELMRVARRFVIISVPSKEDDNPEHIHLFDQEQLQHIFAPAGVRVQYVLNHIIGVVNLRPADA